MHTFEVSKEALELGAWHVPWQSDAISIFKGVAKAFNATEGAPLVFKQRTDASR